jgi:hypothetical protein
VLYALPPPRDAGRESIANLITASILDESSAESTCVTAVIACPVQAAIGESPLIFMGHPAIHDVVDAAFSLRPGLSSSQHCAIFFVVFWSRAVVRVEFSVYLVAKLGR